LHYIHTGNSAERSYSSLFPATTIYTIDFSKGIKQEKGIGIYAGKLKNWQEMRKNLKRNPFIRKKVLPPRGILISIIYKCVAGKRIEEKSVKLL